MLRIHIGHDREVKGTVFDVNNKGQITGTLRIEPDADTGLRTNGDFCCHLSCLRRPVLLCTVV